MRKILVIGASNIDIIGISQTSLLNKDSNVGRVNIFFGGVAKNISENLFRLEEEVSLFTFIGQDYFGDLLKNYFDYLGIDYHLSFIEKEKESGKYLAVHDSDGSLSLGINDFSIIDNCKASDFEPFLKEINSFDVLVFDTNLPQETLCYLIQKFKDKVIIVDGVSQSKVKRIKTVLPFINILKVNLQELASLLDKKVDDVILGVRELIDLGLEHVVVTNGKEPITYNIDKKIYQTLIFETNHVKTSVGAGDALLAGIIYGFNQDKSMHESVDLGKKAASLSMEVDQACNPLLTKKILEE
ncbi:MAG: bifunctional hydroxymethylpyrimidine kinase/phosphomethylpyrimidine kinase [Firmicutes bacterium]|nr:bifunctional hydroxymethylpyrimidine kinase/phosphomethylpyrimidine kinase [Bacillota bacterium]